MPLLAHGEGEAEAQVLRGLRLAVELTILILVLEAVGAYFSRSLALTADAVHDLPDLVAFGISWGALRATERGVTAESTYGAHRLEVFASLANASLILGSGLVFGYAGGAAFLARGTFAGPVDAVWLLAAAIPTLGLRVVNLTVLARIPGRVRDLNLRSVVVHLASDIAITAALLAAGGVLLVRPGAAWVDDVAALAVAAVLVFEALPLFRDSWDVLGERSPRGLSMGDVVHTALSVPGVAEIHDVHVWSLCPTLVCMTAHVGVRAMSIQEWGEVATTLRHRMETEHGILHAVFEVEAAGA
ncbi:MAG TPA: cation diffusion facilitator family transporter [Thermoplasmata archaeon]|nr:cation diffusion facilitator family transporter [Thermoplasmata archaeon]